MKVKVPLLGLLLLAAMVGYLMGTAKGRAQRDQIIVKVRERRGSDAGEASADDTGDAAAEDDTVTV